MWMKYCPWRFWRKKHDKNQKVEVAATVVRRDQYPPELSLDIVLAGRSNVGKSSLINRLINRRGLARTSSSPGKTRTLNFYGINDLVFRRFARLRLC